MSYLTQWCKMQQDDRQERQISQGLWMDIDDTSKAPDASTHLRYRPIGGVVFQMQALRVPYETYRKFYPNAPKEVKGGLL